MARRSDHSREQIREMALEAAEKIVSEEGFGGLSARKLASAIGYTVGTLYLVFNNLDDLILQVNGRTLDRLHEHMLRDQNACRDRRSSLLQLGYTYIAFADANPHLWAMIFEHRLPEAQSAPLWFQEKVARMFALVEERLEPLSASRTPQELTLAARAIWGGVHGICILALTNKLGISGKNAVNELTQSLISNYIEGYTHR